MTRGMMVTTLYRLAGEPQVEGTATFQDVKSSAYYANAVAWAEANGIAKGIDTGVFAPNAPVTREQAAAFAYRYVTAYFGQKRRRPALPSAASRTQGWSPIMPQSPCPGPMPPG